jgi:hypothetical protein
MGATMWHFPIRRFVRQASTTLMVALVLSGCSTPTKLSPDQLASLGISNGVVYWHAEQKLLQEGYVCYVSGTRRENFEFSKTVGGFPTCILRIRFAVSDQNAVSNLNVLDPVCLGTP